MKKQILSFAALALGLIVAGCQQGGYSINGTVPEASDGDSVFLIHTHGMEADTLASTVVKDEHFTLTGRQDSTVLAYVVCRSAQHPRQAQLWVENAPIEMSFERDAVLADIKGTLLNEQWSDFLHRNYELNEQGMAIVRRLQDPETGAEEQQQAREELEKLETALTDMHKSVIAANIQNVVGQYLLSMTAEQLEDDSFVDQQLAAIEDAHATECIADLRQRRAVAAQTSVGQPFQDITAQTPDGQTLSVSDVAKNARVLMIDFWASWCGPCRQEMPNVRAAYERFHGQGFEIIGVSLDHDADAWRKAIGDLHMTWPQISDIKGWEAEGAKTYSVRAIPATVLIKDGIIVARNVRGEEIAKTLEELLKD